MALNFDKVAAQPHCRRISLFGELTVGETFIYAEAYRDNGLNLDSNILYIKIGKDVAFELNNYANSRHMPETFEVIPVDLEVNSVKLKGE